MMKAWFALFLLSLTFHAFAIDVTFKLQVKYTSAITSSMTCAGNSCSCPDDTMLEQSSMRCIKCAEGLSYDKKERQCFDPNQETEIKKTDIRLVSEDILQGLQNEETAIPKMCDMSTLVDGKFTNCQCENVSIPLSKERKAPVLTFKRVFNVSSQKCERSGSLVAKVPNLSCYGPREDAFQELEDLNMITVTYERPQGGMMAMCGATSGNHNISILKDEIKLSILDAIMLYVNPRIIPNPNLKEFFLDENSLNY